MNKRWWYGDAALAVLLIAIGVIGTRFLSRHMGSMHVGWPGYVLVLLAALMIAVRRAAPLVTLGVSTAATSAYLVLGYPYGPILLSFMIAVYTMARHVPLARSVIAAAIALLVLLIHLLTGNAGVDIAVGLIPGSAWVVLPFAVGCAARAVAAQRTQSRAETLRQHVDAERLRVAREVHDVVGHGLAAMNMQANIALHVLDKDPGQAQAALSAISRTSAAALDELRATLAVVRTAERAPTPGLDRVDDLCERITESGVEVRRTESGQRREVPSSLGFAAYRVLQESLTNVLKHSDTKVAEVEIHYQETTLVLVISNSSTAPSKGEGLGIPGMRERVSALGGEFSAGERNGTFTVRASLPTAGPA